MILKVDKINRKSLGDCYRKSMVKFLIKTKNISESEANIFVDNQITNNIKIPKVKVIETISPGRTKVNIYTLTDFLNIITDKILTPSGSVYKSINTVKSIVSILIKEFKTERAVVKKKMLMCFSDNNFFKGNIFKGIQIAIKETLNSLPGAFGFPSSLFYDKGSYNAVTSSARCLISNSFTCCEQYLGGNIPIFEEEEAINLLISIINLNINDSVIRQTMEKHGLYYASKEDVIIYLNNSLQMYKPNADLNNNTNFITILSSLSVERLQFVYYHSNMRQVCFSNEKYFKRIIRNTFNKSTINKNVETGNNAFFACDSDIMAIVLTLLSDDVGTTKLDDIPSNPDLTAKLIGMYNQIKEFQNNIHDIFKVFIYHDLNYQKVMTRSSIQRKSVVVSDTDSVIYTVCEWTNWFNDNNDNIITSKSYHIAALITYWLTLANASVMAKFSIAAGAIGEDVKVIQMKNEFTYPVMLIYNIKKVYAALMAVQEGVVMSELKDDIKGASIRGVGAGTKAKEFIKSFMVEDVLKPIIHGNISATYLINKVITFEKEIKASLLKGELTYLPLTSVRTESMYKKSDSSAFFYADAWNKIFGKKYGEIRPPDKLPLLKINKPMQDYWEWLSNENSSISDRFNKFIEDKKKFPNAFFIEPHLKSVPKELLPLININEITFFNVNSIYLTLESLNINIGFDKKKLLLSDIYP